MQFIGVYHPPNQRADIPPTLVMEKMDCNLLEYVKNNSPIPLRKMLSILHGVSQGMCYLHGLDPPLIHRDLTPRNILVKATSNSLVTKVSDWMAMNIVLESRNKKFKQYASKPPETVEFMPPEVSLYETPQIEPPYDVFSYGGVIIHLVTGDWPAPADLESNTIVLSEVQRCQQYLNKMNGESAALKPLVEECLADDPTERPTMAEVSTKIKNVNEKCQTASTNSGIYL